MVRLFYVVFTLACVNTVNTSLFIDYQQIVF